MQLDITHTTRFTYDRDVQLGPHLLYLRPRETPGLAIRRFSLDCTPSSKVEWMLDDFDNSTASVRFSGAASELEITTHSEVSTSDVGPFEFLVRDYASTFPFDYEPLHRFNLGIYLEPPAEQVRMAVARWLGTNFTQQPLETVTWLFELNRALFSHLQYQRRDVAGMQTTLETLRLGAGACRDFAVTLVDIARSVGVAARFVSGYLYDPSREGSCGDMHAWTEVFIPGAGWRGLDPTHGVFCHSAYVPVAHAVVPESVNPVQGSFFSQIPALARMTTDVKVRRAREAHE